MSEPELPRFVVQGIDLRDYIALTAGAEEIHRFQQYGVPPMGGQKRPKYTIEEARYRYADAMLAARTIATTTGTTT